MIRIRECRGLKALFFWQKLLKDLMGMAGTDKKTVKDLARKAHKL